MISLPPFSSFSIFTCTINSSFYFSQDIFLRLMSTSIFTPLFVLAPPPYLGFISLYSRLHKYLCTAFVLVCLLTLCNSFLFHHLLSFILLFCYFFSFPFCRLLLFRYFPTPDCYCFIIFHYPFYLWFHYCSLFKKSIKSV